MAIFDISCKCNDGKTFIIEMQKGYQKYFRERALYYTTYPINKQGRKARDEHETERLQGKAPERFNWDFNLKPVIVVAILNFQFRHAEDWEADRYRASYRIREDITQEVMTEVLRFVFLELGRFRKQVCELTTDFEKWVYLLKNMHKLKEIPPEFADSMFARLFLLAEIGKFTPEEQEHYYKSLENMGDYYNIIHTAEEIAENRGIEKGRAEGRAEGERKKQIEVARNLKALGVDIDTIVKASGLDRETVEGL